MLDYAFEADEVKSGFIPETLQYVLEDSIHLANCYFKWAKTDICICQSQSCTYFPSCEFIHVTFTHHLKRLLILNVLWLSGFIDLLI